MKNLLMIIFLIGIFAIGCSSPPDIVKPQKAQTEFIQVADLQVSVPVLNVQDETKLPAPDTPFNMADFLKNNAAELILALFAFLKVVVNLTPTSKDNKIFGMLDTFINWIVPNFKTGGGKIT
ncbi:MAG: hypothetical protein ACOYMF_05650 [Bacteroidales bacterium]